MGFFERKQHDEPKSESLRKHFKRRAYERYGLRVTDNLYRQIIAAIQNNNQNELITETRFLRKTSVKRTVWLVIYDGIEMVVVYHKELHELITALPHDCREITDDSISEDLSGL